MGIHEKVFIVEDHDTVADMEGIVLKNAGHEIVGHSPTVPSEDEVREAVGNGMTVAIVDGSLGSGRGGCADGIETAARIRKLSPGTIIVACTSNSFEEAGYGDYYVGKSESMSAQKLVKIVTSITRPQKQ